MQRRAWILGLITLPTAIGIGEPAEAGLFRKRQHQQNPGYATAPAYVYPNAQRTRGFRLFPYGPGAFGYNGDPSTPANGYGYGQTAAGYGSAYPAHPQGPGWPNSP